MRMQFVFAPSNMWRSNGEGNSISSIFSQIRLCEERIANNINPVTERKRHHKLCSLIENIASDGLDDRSLELALELPIQLKNGKTVSGNSYLQLMELLKISQNRLLMEENLEMIKVNRKSWIVILIEFVIKIFAKPDIVEIEEDPRSINQKPIAHADLCSNLHGSGEFSVTPDEVKKKRGLFVHLIHNDFEEIFGETMDNEIAEYSELVSLIYSMYSEAHKHSCGVLTLVKPSYTTTRF